MSSYLALFRPPIRNIRLYFQSRHAIGSGCLVCANVGGASGVVPALTVTGQTSRCDFLNLLGLIELLLLVFSAAYIYRLDGYHSRYSHSQSLLYHGQHLLILYSYQL